MNSHRISIRIIFWVSMMLFFVTSVTAGPAKTDEAIKVGIFSSAPLVYVDNNGFPKGIFVDIIDAISKAEGWNIKYVNGSWNEGLENVRNGRIDLMTSVMHLPRREFFLDFTKESVSSIWGQLYTHKDNDIAGIFDLQGKTIGVLKGGANGENFIRLAQKIGIDCDTIEFDSQRGIVKAINEKSLHAGVFTNIYGHNFQQNYHIKQTQIVFDPSYLKFATTNGANQKLLTTIDAYLSEWKSDGNSIYYEIMKKHLSMQDTNDLPHWVSRLSIIGASFTGIILAGFFILLAFNKRQKNVIQSRTSELVDELNLRKSIEKELRISEKKYRDVIEGTEDLVTRVDCHGNFEFVNHMSNNIVGIDSGDVRGRSAFEFVHPEDRENTQSWFEKCIKQKRSRESFENRLFNKVSGEIFYMLWTCNFIYNKEGDFVGVNSIGHNITELKKAEESLISSKQKLDLHFLQTPLAVIEWDMEFKVRSWNPSAEKIFGYSEKEMLGKHASVIVHQNDKEQIDAVWAGLLKQKGGTRSSNRNIHKNGETIFCEWFNTPIMNDAGETIAVFSLAQDITERIFTQETLAKSEERFRTMMNTMKDGVTICSPDYKIEFMNTAMQERVGLKTSDGKCYKVIYNRDEKCPWCVMDRVEKGEYVEYNLENPERDKNYSIVNAPIANADGSISKLTIFRDLTKSVKMERKLRQSQKMEAIGTLAGGIAHDFNNILFPIMGHTEMLLGETEKDSYFYHGLSEIYSASMRAKDLVKQILTFSRQDENELISIKIQPILKEALKLIRATIPSTIEIKQEFKGDCGAVKANPTQIHQIMMNLSINAYHAMRETGGVLKVSLNEVKIDEFLAANPDMGSGVYNCLTVADTGIGMDKEMVKKIFDPFFTTKAKGEGTGMGLSVVHGIVKAMGGTINVLSQPGKGTKINVYMPSEKKPIEAKDTRQKSPIPGGNERILLVDDEESILAMEQKALERFGYKVSSRTSSIEALEAFKAAPGKYDLVISDVSMPKLSGDKLASELINIRPDIPVLLCTGFSETVTEETASELGVKGLLMKPVIVRELAETIRNALG